MCTWETGWVLGALGKCLWQELNLSLWDNPAAVDSGVLTRSCLLAMTCITVEEHFTCGSSALELMSFPCFPSGHRLAFSKLQLFEQEIDCVWNGLYWGEGGKGWREKQTRKVKVVTKKYFGFYVFWAVFLTWLQNKFNVSVCLFCSVCFGFLLQRNKN